MVVPDHASVPMFPEAVSQTVDSRRTDSDNDRDPGHGVFTRRRDGTIRWAFVDTDYTARAEPSD
ncbi:hypothetical protein ACWCPC_29180, partial [Streptomyces decoyicus]